jgi:hypothetical protein
MSQHRSDVPPSTLGVELQDGGVAVEYVDGRTVFYHGVPEPIAEPLTTPPGKEVHILVTDPSGTEGVMTYVNDRKTHDEVLESTGVGRVILEPGESEELFPGVRASRLQTQRTEVDADPELARGRVFVFVEDDWSEETYEFVPEEDLPASTSTAESESDADPGDHPDASETEAGASAGGWIEDDQYE